MLYRCPYCGKLTDITLSSSYICPKCMNEVIVYNINEFEISNNILKRYKGNKKIVIVPKEVKHIGSCAFSLNRNIEKVYLHHNIISIGSEAFYKAQNLQVIYLRKNIEVIKDNAFKDCDKLTILTDYLNKPSGWANNFSSDDVLVVWGVSKYHLNDNYEYVINNLNQVFLLRVLDKKIKSINLENLLSLKIKAICSGCFENCELLQDVIIPNDIYYIGNYSFKNCKELNNIILPKELKYLGKYCFDNCINLLKIIITENLKYFDLDSFSNCNLESLEILSAKTIIVPGKMWNRKALKTLILPKEMKDVADLAFKGCLGLEYIRLPKEIRGKLNIPTKCKVDEYDEIKTSGSFTKMIRILERVDEGISVKATFLNRRAYRYNCYYKAEVGDIVYAVYKGDRIKGVVVDYLDKISNTPGVNTITEVYRMVPDDFDYTTIDKKFYNNKETIDKVLFALDRLKEGYVSDEYQIIYLDYLKKVFFINGNGLVKYLLDNMNYEYIDVLLNYSIIYHNINYHNLENLIEYCVINNHIMIVPKLLEYQYQEYPIDIKELSDEYIIKNNPLIDSINLPKSLKVIQKDVFKDTFIKNLYYFGSINDYLKIDFKNPYSNPLINNGYFYYLDNNEFNLLKEIEISNCQKISDYSFAFINSLEKVVIKEDVKEIGTKAFMDCVNLNTIIIEGDIFNIGAAAFSGTSIKEFVLPLNITEINANLFMNCRRLERIEIHQNVKRIADYAFYSCVSLKEIKLSNSIKEIGIFAFANNQSLVSVDIPDSVIKIGGSCFLACERLKSINLSNNIYEIDDFCFKMCYSLEMITIPKNVRRIGSLAFYKCSNLKQINLSGNLKTIGLRAFKDCVALQKMIINNGIESIGLNAFENCYAMRYIYIPRSCHSIENNAFIGCKNIIIYLEVSEQEYHNYNYQYYGLDNILGNHLVKWECLKKSK